MPDPSIDLMLGRMLVGRGLLTPERLRSALIAQNRRFKEGDPIHLGEIVVESGWVDQDRIDELLQLQYRHELIREEEMSFGRIAVRNDLISETQLKECVDVQRRLAETGRGRLKRLGEILVEKGYLSMLDSLAILRAQHRLRTRQSSGDPFGEGSDNGRDNGHREEADGGRQEPGEVTPERPEDRRPPPLPGTEPSGGRRPPPLPEARPAALIVEEIVDVDMDVDADEGPRPRWTSPADPIVGRTFHGYEILERIAAGGMGTVYKAEQLSLSRTVAVKVLKERHAKNTEYIHRFLREANAAARIAHGNIVQVHDLGEFEGYYYIVMEYVEGRSLFDMIRLLGPLPAEQAADLILQAARALAAGHRHGVLHKDIKPENILVNEFGEVKVADYGLCRITDFDTGSRNKKKILGTVGYMSPEQIEGRDLDIRTDIYSLGVTLFESLTAMLPFDGEEPMDVAMAHLQDPVPTPRQIGIDIPDDLYDIMGQMLEKEPHDRQPTPNEVIEDLADFLADHEERRPRRRRR